MASHAVLGLGFEMKIRVQRLDCSMAGVELLPTAKVQHRLDLNYIQLSTEMGTNWGHAFDKSGFYCGFVEIPKVDYANSKATVHHTFNDL